MPVEVYVGRRRLEELSEEERCDLGKRIAEESRRNLQAWVNENFDRLLREEKEEWQRQQQAKGA